MSVFDKNKIVLASRKTTLKLINQTLEVAKEVNLSPDSKKSFNEEIASIQQSTEKLELVLAVVGIMKAGKSTLINSIVGKELLPSRNTAMTVIPTYIKHDQSITGVSYHFKHAIAFSDLLRKLKQDGFSTNHETSLIAQRLANENYTFNETLDSLKQIHEELEVINDICRVCFEKTEYRDELNAMFRNSDDFPTLLTEFKVLKSVKTGCDISNFVVVDTPGANEAKLPILKNIVDKQIERSSALLLVLNYTDLASEADEAMRIRIKEEASAYKDRLIVAVNRFDAKDHRSMKKSETVRYVKEELLEDIDLDDNFIFPVSARNALLSNQALEFLANHDKFKLDSLQGWQRDFLDNTTSGEWDEEDEDDLEAIENPKETLRLANKMFKSSKIGEFIDTAITRAYQNAGPDTLIASLTKLNGLIEKRLIRCLETDIDSSKKTVEELNQRVIRVGESLNALKELMNSTEKKLEGWQENQIQDTEKLINNCIKELKPKDVGRSHVSNQSLIDKDVFVLIKGLRDKINNRKPNEEINHEDFKKRVSKIVEAIQKNIDKTLQESSMALSQDLQSDVDKFSSFVESDLLGDINLSAKSVDIQIEFNHNAINKDDYFESKTKEKKRARKVFGFDLSFIPVDFIAYETYEETKTEFLYKSYNNAIMDQLKAIHKDNLTLIKEKLQGVADEYKREIEQLCETVHHSATSMIEKKAKVTEEQKVIESYLKSQIIALDDVAENCQEIVCGLEKEKEA